MVQILEDAPSFAQQIARGQGEAIGSFGAEMAKSGYDTYKQKRENAIAGQQQAQEDTRISELLGQDISGIRDPKMKALIVENLMKGQQAQQKLASEKPDLTQSIKALNTLEGLIPKKGIGWSSFNYGQEARHNRGQFEATQAAIMPLFKSMFPRGMTEKEFKFVNENYMPQINDSEAKMRGKIKGLRALFAQPDHESAIDMVKDKMKAPRKMRDSKGDEYDIPPEYYEEAIKQGLME